MKTIKLAFALIIAALAMTACVEDKVYEGPNTIESLTLDPEAPTSADDVLVTAKVSGLMSVTKAVLSYSVDGDLVEEIEMNGSGDTYIATIPAMADGTKVDVKIVVTNEAGYTSVAERSYTVYDLPNPYKQLVLNELYGAAAEDNGKYIELYNNGDEDLSLEGVIIMKDEAESWVGEAGEVIKAHSFFNIVGAKGALGEGGSGPNPRPLSSGFSAKKSVLIELYDPSGNLVDKFQRGEKGGEWGAQSLSNNKKTWSRCPNGTGLFMIADNTLGTMNPESGEADETVVQ